MVRGFVSARSVVPRDMDIRALALDPTNPARVFAATADGVFVTTIVDATWTKSGNSPPNVRALELAPSQPDLLFALGASQLQKIPPEVNSCATRWRFPSGMKGVHPESHRADR
jgi:hypothetical protein